MTEMLEINEVINGVPCKCLCQPSGSCRCDDCPAEVPTIFIQPVLVCQSGNCAKPCKDKKCAVKTTKTPKTTTTITPVPLCPITAMIPCDSHLEKSRLKNHIKIVKIPAQVNQQKKSIWSRIFGKKQSTTTTTTSIPGVFYLH